MSDAGSAPGSLIDDLFTGEQWLSDLPKIGPEDHFVDVVRELSITLKWHFSTLDADDPKINETRATACEIVAWRYLSRLSEREAVDFCLYEIEPLTDMDHTPIVRKNSDAKHAVQDPTSSFIGLTALEIAVVSDSKKFLSQAIIQKIITGIWKGDIYFWEDLNEHSVKQPQFYNRAESKPYARLKVPKYIKTFEFIFFVCFLILYYVVLMERDMYRIYPSEIMLYIWFAAFAYDEFSEFIGAGTMVYSVDIWNAFDSIIILIGAAFMGLRAVGMIKHNDDIVNTAFDILSLEALFMVPRLCSLLSLLPYFATLIPCLKAMMTDFIKFMVIVGIIQIVCVMRESFSRIFANAREEQIYVYSGKSAGKSNADSARGRSYVSGSQTRVQSNMTGGAIDHEEFTSGGMLKNVDVEIPGPECAVEIAMVKERETELEEKVAALSVQIAELTALIMKSQNTGGFGD
ncbi:putative Calcium channel YVC1 [Glarea lozoyensis 74030]|uniref:Putative Calcium channel YVC1 n=1 Tax=Glarea lozoyensis (strain ATCC 74030 / MF5533) TaxID=1104152 RepID=H0EMN9_GLAL7|nr:putative Calcium channel YVC1 [Glarea lozoyensis 74030]